MKFIKQQKLSSKKLQRIGRYYRISENEQKPDFVCYVVGWFLDHPIYCIHYLP